MAYIPDRAIVDHAQISGRSFLLFCWMCRHGSMKKNRIRISLSKAAKELSIQYDNCTRYAKELREKGWIMPLETGELDLLKGFDGHDLGTVKITVSEDTKEHSEIGKIPPEPERPVDAAGAVFNGVDPTVKITVPTVKITVPDPTNTVKITVPDCKNYSRHIKGSLTSLLNQQDPKKEIRKKPPSSGTRVPEPFEITPEMRKWAITPVARKGGGDPMPAPAPDVDLDVATEQFVDYWRGLSGKAGVKVDWQATWRNSMRYQQNHIDLRSNKYGKQQNQNGAGASRQPAGGGRSNGSAEIAARYNAKPKQIV
jgi:hypothetical protein